MLETETEETTGFFHIFVIGDISIEVEGQAPASLLAKPMCRAVLF